MATIVGSRTGLFFKNTPGGLPFIQDIKSGTGNVFFVDGSAPAAQRGTTAGFGQHPDKPLSTIQSAIDLATASQGDRIFVLPGHTETLAAAAAIDVNKAGVTIIGLGSGSKRPTLTLDTATTATFKVSAADADIFNILFKVNLDSMAKVLDVVAKQCRLYDVEIQETSAKQFLIGVNVGTADNDSDGFEAHRCVITQTGAGADSAIKFAKVVDRAIVEDCWIDGDWTDAGIHNPTGAVCTKLLLQNNVVRNRQTGDHAIELVSACTGEAVGNMLMADTPGIVFDPGSLFCAQNYEAHKIDSGAVPSPAGLTTPDQWIHVAKATATLPATTTQNIFTVAGGRVLVKLLLGEVTTVIQAQITNLKATSAPTTGTAVDLASNLDINAKEAGTLLLVEGDGTALVGANAGAALSGVGMMGFIVPIGTIRIETGATSTGATKWDLWYLPLDAGARVVSA